MTQKVAVTLEPRVVDLDPILEELGAFGRFQQLNYALMLLPVIFTAFFTTSYVFTAADDPHRCLISECEEANTTEFRPEWLRQADWTVGQCRRREADNHTEDAWSDGTCNPDTLTETIVPCDSWVYQDRLTIASEFQLGCAEWKRTLVGTVNSVGQLACLPLTGLVSDRWGRRTALLLGVLLSAVLGLVRSFAPTYLAFIALEFLDPALGSGVYSSAFILAVELVGPRHRVAGGALVAAYYSLGEALLALVAWRVRYWRHLLRALYAPALPLLAYFWLAPESVRWLLAQGRADDASRALARAARLNRVALSTKSLEDLRHNVELEAAVKNGAVTSEKPSATAAVSAGEHTETYYAALRSGRMALRVACCAWMWATCTLLYYGISLSSAALAGGAHLNFALVSLVELPAHAATPPALARAGRRPVLAAAFLLAGAACAAFALVPDSIWWARISLFLVGKFSITMAFTVLYVYTTELFPTPLRHSLLATCSMLGRLGSIAAPQAPLLATVAEWLPYAVFGVCAMLAGALVLSFPETRGRPLPDTIAAALSLRRSTPDAKPSAPSAPSAHHHKDYESRL